MWALLAVLAFFALLIPTVAILVDSPLGRSLARRLEGQGGGDGVGADLRTIQQKVDLLEGEIDELQRSVTGMREELQFVQRLLENPKKKTS